MSSILVNAASNAVQKYHTTIETGFVKEFKETLLKKIEDAIYYALKKGDPARFNFEIPRSEYTEVGKNNEVPDFGNPSLKKFLRDLKEEGIELSATQGYRIVNRGPFKLLRNEQFYITVFVVVPDKILEQARAQAHYERE